MSDELEHETTPETPETVAETLERDERGRFVVEEESEAVDVVPEPTPTPVSVAKPKRKAEAPERWTSATPAPSAPSAVGGVTVSLSALVYHARSRNSASVAAVQDRLTELGHADARADIRGWLSDGTVTALSAFQKASGLKVTGKADRETVEALMAGTGAVVAD